MSVFLLNDARSFMHVYNAWIGHGVSPWCSVHFGTHLGSMNAGG